MSSSLEIIVGARASPLSQVQVKEVWEELKRHVPGVIFKPLYVKTRGDLDQQTSLRTLDKTDFFTREIDERVLQGTCRIGIHSAKDLPDPLPKGLKLVALTQGVDSSDALVMREGEMLSTLPQGARIATSSLRREECVKQLRPDFTFVDIRGTIEERLSKLDSKQVDGVVIAEAALIRLGWTHRNRITLPGPPADNQGRLAVIAQEDDREMITMFNRMDYQLPLCCKLVLVESQS